MLEIGAGEIGDVSGRIKGVAIIPRAAVHRVEIIRSTSNGCDRWSAGHRFTIRDQIGLHVKHGLSAPRMKAEARHHFVEDQSRSGLTREFSRSEEHTSES